MAWGKRRKKGNVLVYNYTSRLVFHKTNAKVCAAGEISKRRDSWMKSTKANSINITLVLYNHLHCHSFCCNTRKAHCCHLIKYNFHLTFCASIFQVIKNWLHPIYLVSIAIMLSPLVRPSPADATGLSSCAVSRPTPSI